MKNNRKKYLSGGAIVIVLLLLTTAVFRQLHQKRNDSGGIKKESNVVSLKLWYPWTDKYEQYEKIFLRSVEEYNQKYPEIQIQPEGTEMEFYREKLPSDIASNDTPDIYFCFTGGYLKDIVDSGRILQINQWLDNDLSTRIHMDTLKNMTFEDGIYGLSYVETAGIFLVNKDLFQRYECDFPQTWDELLTACNTFLGYGITPLACSGDGDIGFRMYLEALCVNETGSEECKDITSGKCEISDKFLEGIQKFKQLVDMGAFGENPVQNNTLEVEEKFMMSKIPMYYTKSSFLGNIIQKNSPLYGKVCIIPFPGNGLNEYFGGVSECFVINSETKYPKEAVFALQKILQKFSVELYESGAGIPTWKTDGINVSDQKLYRQMLQMYEDAKIHVQFWEITMNGKRRKEYLEKTRKYFEMICSGFDAK